MKRITSTAAVIALVLSNPVVSTANGQMTLEFSWLGTVPCKTLSDNPPFKLRNLPNGTKRVHLALTEGEREMGGQTVDIPEGGNIPAGVLRTNSPCNPTYYRWTATAISASGKVLGQAYQSRFFPTDEVLPTQ